LQAVVAVVQVKVILDGDIFVVLVVAVAVT
jgi:hypothetical protein